jgi:biopolymer transport protein ExbD
VNELAPEVAPHPAQTPPTAAPRDPELQPHAHVATRYDKPTDILAAAQKAGINKIAFVTDPDG